MSQRGKRQNRLDNDDPPPYKRRKGRPPSKGGAASTVASIAASLGTSLGPGNGSGSIGSGKGANNGRGATNSNANIQEHSNDTATQAATAQAGTSGGASTSVLSSAWQARPLTDLKISSIYNRSAPEPPAELFRKDLISAMKLPDSEPLASDEYWVITDQWKQEWERGVQVPVSPDSLPEPTVLAKQQESFFTGRQDFKL